MAKKKKVLKKKQKVDERKLEQWKKKGDSLARAKSGNQWAIPMPEEVCEAVEGCCAGKDSEDHVFTWPNGKPILDFRASWEKACKEAGVAGLRFHDLRRSATRNIMRKGVPATVAMKITGHLTRAVFDTYDVTADQDLLDAAGRI